jgi:hypothetical protein
MRLCAYIFRQVASFTTGDQKFCEIVTVFRLTYQDLVEQERLVAASPVMTKSWEPSWGKQLPGVRPRETAKT